MPQPSWRSGTDSIQPETESIPTYFGAAPAPSRKASFKVAGSSVFQPENKKNSIDGRFFGSEIDIISNHITSQYRRNASILPSTGPGENKSPQYDWKCGKWYPSGRSADCLQSKNGAVSYAIINDAGPSNKLGRALFCWTCSSIKQMSF